MCGVIGILGQNNVNQAIYDGLTVLQHRGQDAAGILTSEDNRVNLRKDNGLVKDVFQKRHMTRLLGRLGIGHCRYPTAGSSSPAEAQPFYVNSPFGIALAHNGNLTNATELREELFRDDLRHLNTSSDSEILTNVLAHEIYQVLGSDKYALTPEDVFSALEGVYTRINGGYAVVACIVGFGLVAFRDKFGIRPLVYGERVSDEGVEHIVASESVALDTLDFELINDIEPGEALIVEMDGTVHRKVCAPDRKYSPCIFEHVYMARPDSMMDGISVYKTRLRMGEMLAKKIQREWPDNDIDVVIPIPDTSRTTALQLANELKVNYREGFIKNRYIGRTFIMPGQEERKKSVKQKLNAIDLEFRGKNVLLVDDSIVRGTTSEQIVQMARDAGATKVYFASGAPAVRYPNVYGIDMPAASELVANDRSDEDVCEVIGADRLFYQDLDDLVEAASAGNPDIKEFDTSCFNSVYVTGDVSPAYLERLESDRNDQAKTEKEEDGVSVRDVSRFVSNQ
ncbi:MAG: amidophosphoribosyltransferase [Arenicella sp.]